MARVQIIAVRGLPLVKAGDDLASLIVEAAMAQGDALISGDVLVIAQKVVSKSENTAVHLGAVRPSDRAEQIAQGSGKDARVVQVVLDESAEIVRASAQALIVEHRSGHVMANGGVDASNVDGSDVVLKLPADSDRSAALLRQRIGELTRCDVAVIINDSWGRPWRRGTVGHCLGCAGLAPIWDRRGEPDLFGRELQTTEVAIADEMAAAASLVMGAAGEGLPAVIIRGYVLQPGEGTSRDILRPRHSDLFR